MDQVTCRPNPGNRSKFSRRREFNVLAELHPNLAGIPALWEAEGCFHTVGQSGVPTETLLTRSINAIDQVNCRRPALAHRNRAGGPFGPPAPFLRFHRWPWLRHPGMPP
jgi:hypothetical protein